MAIMELNVAHLLGRWPSGETLTTKEVASKLKITTPQAYKILSELETTGYISKHGYRISPGVWESPGHSGQMKNSLHWQREGDTLPTENALVDTSKPKKVIRYGNVNPLGGWGDRHSHSIPDPVVEDDHKVDPEKPSLKWASWALLNEVAKETLPPVAAIAIERLRQLTDTTVVVFIAIGSDGYWGRGKTLVDAVKAMALEGSSKSAVVVGIMVLNDPAPTVTEHGGVVSDAPSQQFRLGRVGTVGSILKANP